MLLLLAAVATASRVHALVTAAVLLLASVVAPAVAVTPIQWKNKRS
jgi:hypothetical protein